MTSAFVWEKRHKKYSQMYKLHHILELWKHMIISSIFVKKIITFDDDISYLVIW